MSQPLLTVIVMARDEEEVLPQCLESLRGVWDELILLDAGGSTDRTHAIAESFGAKVHRFPKHTGTWPLDERGNEIRDYAAARNYGESLARGRYVYWQDADEVLEEGAERIREIAEQGKLEVVRPVILIVGEEGRPSEFPRQDLLHKKGAVTWRDPFHEFTVGGKQGDVDPAIRVRQIDRPSGDRPHGDELDLIRRNMAKGLSERHLYYLQREHANRGHWQEVIALSELIARRPPEHAQQRSLALILKGDAFRNLEDLVLARRAYLEAIGEWGQWAEPYYALGVLCVLCERWKEAVAWLSSSMCFEPEGETHASENVTLDIYTWRRFDLMSIALAKLGRLPAALEYTKKALDGNPDDDGIRERLRFLQEALHQPALYALPGKR